MNRVPHTSTRPPGPDALPARIVFPSGVRLALFACLWLGTQLFVFVLLVGGLQVLHDATPFHALPWTYMERGTLALTAWLAGLGTALVGSLVLPAYVLLHRNLGGFALVFVPARKSRIPGTRVDAFDLRAFPWPTRVVHGARIFAGMSIYATLGTVLSCLPVLWISGLALSPETRVWALPLLAALTLPTGACLALWYATTRAFGHATARGALVMLDRMPAPAQPVL